MHFIHAVHDRATAANWISFRIISNRTNALLNPLLYILNIIIILKLEHMWILLLSKNRNNLIPIIIQSNLIYNHSLRHYNGAIELSKLRLNQHWALMRSRFADNTWWRLGITAPLNWNWRLRRAHCIHTLF